MARAEQAKRGTGVTQYATPRTPADVLRQRGKLGPYGGSTGAQLEDFTDRPPAGDTAQEPAAPEKPRKAASKDPNWIKADEKPRKRTRGGRGKGG